MKKRIIALMCTVMILGTSLVGCAGTGSNTEAGSSAENSTGEISSIAETESAEKQVSTADSSEKTGNADMILEDGTYSAEFTTDSGMFHVSEACEGKGTLTVKDGEMMIHISLGSKNIVNLYPGLAADAQKEDAELLQPTVDTVKYSDGTTEEVNGFDVPVPALDQEFDLALIGTKGKWYDHKVVVSNPIKAE